MGNSLGKAEDGKDEIFQTLKAKKKEIKKKKKRISETVVENIKKIQ